MPTSPAAAPLTLDIARGEDKTFLGHHVVSASDSTPVNITGYTIQAVVRRNVGDQSPLFVATGTIVTAATGDYSYPITSAQSLLPFGEYQIDVWGTNAGAQRLMAGGILRVWPDAKYGAA